MEYNNPVYESEGTPAFSPPTTTHFMSTPRNHLVTIEEPLPTFGEPPSAGHYSSSTPPTAVKQEVDPIPTSISNFQDQIRHLQSMFPDKTREEILAFIWPTQPAKVPAASSSKPDVPRSSHRDYPIFGRDPLPTPTQSPRIFPVPLDFLTPVPIPRSVSPP